MRAHLQYLRYVVRHKWFVLLAGIPLGVPIWRLLVHDWTKFQPVEWFPYAAFFYGDYPDHLPGEARSAGLWTKQDVEKAFDLAWNHHQKRNDHHWQYWLLTMDSGITVILPMSDVCRREMLADWRGAGRALGKPDTGAWYRANADNMKLHSDTRQWVEDQLMTREQQAIWGAGIM